MHRGRAVAFDDEAGALRCRPAAARACSAGASSMPPLRTMSKCTLPVARITSWLPAGTATGARVLRRFARAQAGQHHRRPAGVDRRRDPGIDAEIRRRDHAVPVEGGGDALEPLAAGRKESRHHQNEHECAQRHRIAQRQPRRRPAGLELARRQQRALDMRLPERLRHRIVAVGGNVVGDRRRRPVRFAAAAIEPAQPVIDARQPQDQQRQCRRDSEQGRKQTGRSRAPAAATPARDRPRRRRGKVRATVASAASAGHSRSHKQTAARAP